MKQLVIAAHPDDEILGCGGTINKLSQKGVESYVLILTGGAETRYAKEMELVLKNNAIKANDLINTKEVFFENLPNQQLDTIPLLKMIETIEKYIGKIKPESVLTQHCGDLNKDHQLVYEATITAVRPLAGQVVKRLYSYFVPSSTEWNFVSEKNVFIPNVFVDISEEIETKINAMKCYESECRPYPHPRSPEAIKNYALYFGLTVGMHYVEPLRLIRDISGII
ncbi:MAG: PIG-L family deacetylase [Nitrospirae bacterium]|nr:PIG-L family deacetylase [Nitrospirota bacterium]